MTPLQQAVLRTRFPLFLMRCFAELHPGDPPLQLSGYLQAICHHLTEAGEGRLPRLVITVPPRHLKSIAAAVAFCAFQLGHRPSLKIMVASYSQDLSRQHAEQCRTIMESPWYQEIFETRISERGNRQLELVTTAGGVRKAVSVGGSVTGFGADVIIIDDCMKADEANSQAARDELIRWYEGTLLTRLNSKANGVVISIQQRLHEDDLPAYLIEKGYHHLDLPAIAEAPSVIPTGPKTRLYRDVGHLLNPGREDRSTLDQTRRDIGPAAFSAQYQQNPVVPGGNLIPLDWFGTYDGPTPRNCFHKVMQSWDTAATANPNSDWSVCQTWGYLNGDWYLIDVFRARVEYPELKRAVIRLDRQWRPDKILIEQANTGMALVQELRIEGYTHVKASRPVQNKETRMIAQLAELETGRFLLPGEAPWLAAFRAEMRAFPSGKHDDQVDALSQFLHAQKVGYRWVEEERTASGRLLRSPRSRARALRAA